MYVIRAKYIHGRVHSSKFLYSLLDQEYEAQDEESYGCVSLFATVIGTLCLVVAGIGSLLLLYQVVVFGSILLVTTILPRAAIGYGILLVMSWVLLAIVAKISFWADLLNPPR